LPSFVGFFSKLYECFERKIMVVARFTVLF
jgi:hypothetical protein